MIVEMLEKRTKKPASMNIRRTLRKRWQLVSLLCLMPLVALGIILLQEIQSLQHAQMLTHLRSNTQGVANAVDRYLSFQTGQLVALAHSPLLENSDLEAFRFEIARANANHPEWITVILNDSTGQLLNTKFPSGTPLPKLRDPISLRGTFTTATAQLGNFIFGGIALRYPVIVEGQTRYVLTVVLDASAFSELLASQLMPEGWRAQIVDGAHTLVARSVPVGRNVGTAASETYAQENQDVADAIRIVTRDGLDAFAAIAPVRGTSWSVGVTVPVAVIAAPYRRIETILYIGAGSAAALAFAMLVLILREWRKSAARERVRMLLSTAQAKNESREKSAFLANMSHEMRTPLNAIIGFAEIMELKLAGPLDGAKSAEYVHAIAESGRHLLSVINDLLDLSKIEAGRLEVHASSVAVGEVVQAAVSLLRETAAQRGLAVVCAVAEDIRVTADRRLLLQMLINVISNAVKYTDRGEIEISAESHEHGTRITVRDTGPGMNEEELRRVLEPYARGDSELARHQTGTGLGLTLTKRLTEVQGGTFILESTLGAGTTATILMPNRELGSEKGGFALAA